jgi:hypothetical protein
MLNVATNVPVDPDRKVGLQFASLPILTGRLIPREIKIQAPNNLGNDY